jgi:hypothetical protein
MTEPATPTPPAPTPTVGAPGEQRPRRLLDQAPSERLKARAGGGSSGGPPGLGSAQAGAGSSARAVAFGVAAGVASVAAHVVAATVLLWTGALLVVAVTMGIVVGSAVRRGAGRSMRPRARGWLAVGLALGALTSAIGVNWALSGMYLGPLDYLVQVYGLLVPLQAALAVAGAVAGSR